MRRNNKAWSDSEWHRDWHWSNRQIIVVTAVAGRAGGASLQVTVWPPLPWHADPGTQRRVPPGQVRASAVPNLAFKLALAACQLQVQRGNLKARALLRLLLPRRLPVPSGCATVSGSGPLVWRPVRVTPSPQPLPSGLWMLPIHLRREMLQVSWSGCDRCVSKA